MRHGHWFDGMLCTLMKKLTGSSRRYREKALHPRCVLCRYAVGDQSIAETCDSFCTRCGQGHTHFMPCNKALCESDILDGVRHNTDPSLGTNADEYTHAYYWEAVSIEDPCMPEERRTFSLCGNLCASEEHQQVLCLCTLND
jgi:hypothetical protein